MRLGQTWGRFLERSQGFTLRLKESVAKYTSFFEQRVAFRGKIFTNLPRGVVHEAFGTYRYIEGTTNQEGKNSDSQRENKLSQKMRVWCYMFHKKPRFSSAFWNSSWRLTPSPITYKIRKNKDRKCLDHSIIISTRGTLSTCRIPLHLPMIDLTSLPGCPH